MKNGKAACERALSHRQLSGPGNGDAAVGAQAGLASLPYGCRSAAPWRCRKSGLPDLRTKYADLG